MGGRLHPAAPQTRMSRLSEIFPNQNASPSQALHPLNPDFSDKTTQTEQTGRLPNISHRAGVWVQRFHRRHRIKMHRRYCCMAAMASLPCVLNENTVLDREPDSR
jgi:hypothetical protein